MSKKIISVGDVINVKHENKTLKAKVRRIGEVVGGGFVMLTLDLEGSVAYTVARDFEVGR